MADRVEIYNQLKKLEKEGKYAEIARTILDIHIRFLANDQNPEELQGFDDFAEELSQLTPDGKVDPEKKAKVIKIGNEITKLKVQSQIGIAKRVEEWKGRIKNGEVPEAAYLLDDDKFVSSLANDIVCFQTKEGDDLNASTQASLAFAGHMLAKPEWREEFEKDKELHAIVYHTSSSDYVKNYLKELDVPYDEGVKIVKKYETTSNKLKPYNFVIDIEHSVESGEKPKFSEVDPLIKGLLEANTLEELDVLRTSHTDLKDAALEYSKDAKNLAAEAENKWNKLKETVPKGFKTDEYKAFRTALKRVSTIGKNFTITVGGEEREIKEVFPRYVDPAVKELVETSKAYYDQLCEDLSDRDREIPSIKSIIDTVKSISDSSKLAYDKMTKNSSIVKKVTAGSVENLAKNEQANIDLINKAVKIKGLSPAMISKRKHDREIKENYKELEQCIDAARLATVNVYNGSKEYDEALKAISDLSESALLYKDMEENISDEEKRRRIENLRNSSLEAVEKIEAYLTRKSKKKKLDDKATRRVEAMKRSLKVAKSLRVSADDADMDMDGFEAEKLTSEMEEADRTLISDKAEELRAEALKEDRSDVEKVAIRSAASGLDQLKELIASGALTDVEKHVARMSFATLTIMDRKLYDKAGKISEEEYQNQVSKLAEDPDFIKATGPITKDKILDFCGDIKNSSIKLMNKFYEEKSAGFSTPQKPKTSSVQKTDAVQKNDTMRK